VNLISDLLLVFIAGFVASRLFVRLGLPALTGMIAAGILLGPALGDLLSPAIYGIASEIRLLALLLILLKAGLGLDKDKILANGSVAVRLAILPVLIEASVLAASARILLGWEWLYCWLLGWIVCAASPAVIVPLMLQLKSEGWGVDRGIPDLVLSEATVSDAVAITMFGITLAWLGGGASTPGFQLLEIPVQIASGLIVGYIAARILRYLLRETNLTATAMQDTVVTLALGMGVLVGSNYLPYSEYLAIMTMGFILLETEPIVARELRRQTTDLWVMAEILLFVLIGATVSLESVANIGIVGLVIVLLGLIFGKTSGVLLSTTSASFLPKERLFMATGGMAKATVQAAIAGIPLAMGLPLGEEILSIAFVAILFTAPVGSFLTAHLGPRVLERGEVDPTKVTVHEELEIVVAVDSSKAAENALKQAASVARSTGAFLHILHVTAADDLATRYRSIAVPDHFLREYRAMVADIPHDIRVVKGTAAQTIVETADNIGADYIYLGKANRRGLKRVLVGDTANEVINHTEIPVILVDEGNHR